jgi:plasmid maintenance system killer protein
MDWLDLQYKIRHLHESYFRGRQMTSAKIESARNRDIGETAKRIDAVIRAISRENHFGLLSEDEQDILAIRLNWAWKIALFEGMGPFEKIESMSKEDFEHVLIDLWHAEGRLKYQPFVTTSIGGDDSPTSPGGFQSSG